MAQRIKGSEVGLILTSPDGREDSIDAIGSLTLTVQVELLTEGYLGETSNRRDEIFNGVEGSLDVHLERGAYFTLVEKIKDRAARRTPAADRFDLMAVFQFPNGDRRRAVVRDVHFGEIPIEVGGRGDYVSSTINFGAEDLQFLG
jgi:hypothetical protein